MFFVFACLIKQVKVKRMSGINNVLYKGVKTLLVCSKSCYRKHKNEILPKKNLKH